MLEHRLIIDLKFANNLQFVANIIENDQLGKCFQCMPGTEYCLSSNFDQHNTSVLIRFDVIVFVCFVIQFHFWIFNLDHDHQTATFVRQCDTFRHFGCDLLLESLLIGRPKIVVGIAFGQNIEFHMIWR